MAQPTIFKSSTEQAAAGFDSHGTLQKPCKKIDLLGFVHMVDLTTSISQMWRKVV